MLKRTRSMELRAIREQTGESPPPAPSGTSVREWFAGLALMNPVLMAGIPVEKRAAEAARLAEELISALAPARTPSMESMQAPTPEEFEVWEKKIEEDKKRAATTLAPPSKKKTIKFEAILPPPMSVPASPPEALIKRGALPGSTRYMYHGEGSDE